MRPNPLGVFWREVSPLVRGREVNQAYEWDPKRWRTQAHEGGKTGVQGSKPPWRGAVGGVPPQN